MSEISKLSRDASSKALINTDRKALLEHKRQKEQARRIERLENEVSQLRETLQLVLDRLDGEEQNV